MTQTEVTDRMGDALLEYQGREDHLHDVAEMLRFQGATWRQIGAAMGVSASAAQQRFGRTRAPR